MSALIPIHVVSIVFCLVLRLFRRNCTIEKCTKDYQSTNRDTCCFNSVLLSAPPIQEELHNCLFAIFVFLLRGNLVIARVCHFIVVVVVPI